MTCLLMSRLFRFSPTAPPHPIDTRMHCVPGPGARWRGLINASSIPYLQIFVTGVVLSRQ